MGKPFENNGQWPASNEDHPGIDVGEGYYAIGPDLLIEKGDEYLHPSGRFIAFPLEAIGRPVSPGLLARRPEDRSPPDR